MPIAGMEPMDEIRNDVVRYLGDRVTVVSRVPLIGRLRFQVGRTESVELRLDRPGAETLARALLEFLGDDAIGTRRAKPLADEGLRPEELNASNDE